MCFPQLLLALCVLLPVAVQSLMFQPLDCADIYNDGSGRSGVYRIYPAGPNSGRYVYCDMDTEGGKWTVFQRRMDGTVNFYRGWEQYKNGFGHAAGEYWLGLETIHLLTLRKNYELRVDMEDFNGARVYANYTSFSISPQAINAEVDGYRLHVSGFRNGGAGDSLTYANGEKFSTFDKDQDSWGNNCALTRRGGFWFKSCQYTNPNGLYLWGEVTDIGLHWYHWKSNYYSLKSISMKMRPVSLRSVE
ncbi:microfibril-associated glycoprotein 4-like isoform X1 [Alosa sapidissima]|uniref:microfibril-associated glycoprotein 4-like isoform X1 n=1 Tax=Alosa sapidissima TaxID=34773 RepID=UPI001C08D858|nr:microfibril-associated glycoprotein 4-like isoform X1 [Alosa sapidissima]